MRGSRRDPSWDAPITVCERTPHKKQFRSLRRAQRVADAALRETGRRLYPYECPCCRLWHLTKQSDGEHVK